MFNQRSILTLSDGNIAVGGVNGINIFTPSRLRKPKLRANLVFSGLVLFDHPVSVGEEYNNRVILREAINESHEVKLAYDENAFTIQMASSDLGIPENTRFVYRLKGFNDRWMTTDESQASATFTNLKPGTYQLEAKLIDFNGDDISKINTLSIVIMHPLYSTWWAILIYFLLSALIVYHFCRNYLIRRREAQRLADAERQHKLDSMKETFFINVSHEFRTPLTMILSPLSGLIKNEDDAVKASKLKMMQRNAKKLLEMINEMLDLRRLVTRSERRKPSRGDVVKFVKDICSQFIDFTDKHITMTFHSNSDVFITDFDHDKLGRIVSNLLSNAFKFTPEGGRVDVHMLFEDECLVIKVSDSGIGISDEAKKHIFERFYQAENNVANGGSGIGLNLVGEYVRMAGGEVNVSDNAGGGTVFTVKLPVEKVELEGEEYVRTKESETLEDMVPEESKESSADKQRPVLLLVDDSLDFLEFMTSELSDEYYVVTAHDGNEALTRVKEDNPEIVLTDVMMPGMDGNTLCRKLKSDEKTKMIPVMMLTARLTEENEIESRECGADDYITKPFNVDILKMHVRNMLKWHDAGSDGKIIPQIKSQQITSVDQQLVKDATDYVEKNLSNTDISVVTLSEALSMSRVNLYRKLLAATGKTPSEFIRLIRLRHAEQLVMKSQLSVAEISYKVGFSSPRYFSRCYNDLFGYKPSKYRKKD